eukprot:CAMPEP_0184325846 /NCGR_PEP_ID=MMETSP1049-20130417/142251_1 /TAXON_ID=77928 /ORGANISM="Proteomonas sulcata, Strain CCMP704" /LENGTH=35 /DNA_ID= /DNA_START= /DNA_END= /DNA_ORIENTATION=
MSAKAAKAVCKRGQELEELPGSPGSRDPNAQEATE